MISDVDPIDLDLRLSTHEQICAQRYADLVGRMTRIETIMVGSAGAVIAAMGAVILLLLSRAVHPV